jgi:DNA-binding HxlR family transcriptional regulator
LYKDIEGKCLFRLTGIDWKEVDRQIGLLEQYGFVSVDAQEGPIKLYKLTEQGRMLVKLLDEPGKNQPS